MNDKIQICLRINVELNDKLAKIAEKEDISKNKLIERKLKQFVKDYEQK